MRRRRVPLREQEIPQLVRTLGDRHPEFRGIIGWHDFLSICERERISVRVRALPESINARLIRVGTYPFIQLNRSLNRMERTYFGMHELAHWFRDDPGVPCYYADDALNNDAERFADTFAWYCTSPARDALTDLC